MNAPLFWEWPHPSALPPTKDKKEVGVFETYLIAKPHSQIAQPFPKAKDVENSKYKMCT